MSHARVLLVAGALPAVVLAAMLAGCRRQAVSETAQAVASTPTPQPAQIVLFFPGDDDLLHREAREIPELPAVQGSRIRLVLEELLAGSRTGLAPSFTWPATVDAVFVDGNHNAFVDFAAPPADAVEGTSTEIALAYSTVNSVVANCPGIERVQLLFGGHEVSTFGHLDLSRPLAPRPELIAP